MKTLKIFLPALFMVVIGVTISAQSQGHMNMTTTKTETLKVWGNCDECKARIEKTVKAEGATSADWNMKTKILTVTSSHPFINITVSVSVMISIPFVSLVRSNPDLIALPCAVAPIPPADIRISST